MKIVYFKGEHPNFGDDLNWWMWPRLLPNFFDEDDSAVFIGIGSILGERDFRADQKKIVFSPGYVPQYHKKPEVTSSDWDVFFVRGPRTASMLGLPADKALGDGAILLREVVKFPLPNPHLISFMPHWQSMERGNWKKVCEKAGIHLIDPRDEVENVLAQIQQSKVIIAEAMHGAIVADALRVPWVPLVPLNHVHRDKWYDWADALNLKLNKNSLWPSSLLEARLSFIRPLVSWFPLNKLIEAVLIRLAAYRLMQLAKAPTQMSDDTVITKITDEMKLRLAQLVEKYRK